MSYQIRLTDREVETLAWATDRGYFPEEAYDDLSLKDGESEEVDKNTLRTWELSEAAAWSIPMAREEDEYALFNSIGGDLLNKLCELEHSIV